MKPLAIILLGIFLFSTCSSNKHIKSKDFHYYERLTTTFIVDADLTKSLEIDSGKFTLLKYEYFSDVKHRTHSFHGKNIYFKMSSINVLKTTDHFEVPSSVIDVKAFFSNYRCFVCSIDSIYGDIYTLGFRQDSVTLALNLKYNSNSEPIQLLVDTVTFTVDSDFFNTFFKDYDGIYDNLRIALKKPLDVKELDLFGYKLTYGLDSLPEAFGSMTNLESLDLSNLGLKTLPQSFGDLVNLRKLDLSYNEFEEFPMQICKLKNLEVLNLQLSHIDSIPAEINELRNLRILILDDNKFRDFPLIVTELTNLETLSITSSNIKSIPNEIEKLKNLRRLDLSSFWSYKDKNQITDISNITRLTKLETLELDWNKINKLPDNLCDLEHLSKLSLLSNPIRKIPENIKNCGIDTILVDN